MTALTRILFGLSAPTALFGVHAHADMSDTVASAKVTADVRCLIVGLGLGNVHGVTAQTAGMMSIFYYLGRLDAHTRKLDLETLIANEAAKWTQADMRSEVVRCGSEITERGKQLQTMAQHLLERGNQQELEQQQQKQ